MMAWTVDGSESASLASGIARGRPRTPPSPTPASATFGRPIGAYRAVASMLADSAT